jgi:hypothetical protein
VKYLIIGQRYGGEHTIGTLPKEVADYWEEQSDFEEYIFDTDDRNEDGTIPKKYQLSNWYEHSDVMCEYALEFYDGNTIDVMDAETNEYVAEGIDVTTLAINSRTDDEDEHRTANEDFDGGYIFGQGFDKSAWEFELETDKHFDITKLKVNVSVWSDLLLVTSLTYDGGNVGDGYSDGSVGKSFSAWIE